MENSSVNPMQQRAGDDVSDEVKPRGPSLAYMKSMKQSEFRKADLESKGIGALDFEYRDTMAEEEGDERQFGEAFFAARNDDDEFDYDIDFDFDDFDFFYIFPYVVGYTL